jgi:Bacterial protein of unknown function (DUF937)
MIRSCGVRLAGISSTTGTEYGLCHTPVLILTNLGSLFGGGTQTQDAVRTGQGMIESLFGSKLGGDADLIARSSGLRAASVTSLMALIGPIILAVLGRQRAAAGGGLAALPSLLGEQKGFMSGLLPAGLASMLGWPVLLDMSKRGNLDRRRCQLSDAGRGGLRLASATRRR